MTARHVLGALAVTLIVLTGCTGGEEVAGLDGIGTDGPGDVAPRRADLLGHDPAIEIPAGGCVTSLRVQAGGADQAGPRWLTTFTLAEVPEGSLAAVVGADDCAGLIGDALAEVLERLGGVRHDALDVTWVDPEGRRWIDP